MCSEATAQFKCQTVNPRDEKGVLLDGEFWWDEDVIKLKDEVEALIRDVAVEDIDAVLESFKQSKAKSLDMIHSVGPHPSTRAISYPIHSHPLHRLARRRVQPVVCSRAKRALP